MKQPFASAVPAELRFGSFTWKLTLRLALLVTVTSAIVLTAGGGLLSRQWRRNIDAVHETELRELDQIVAEVAPLTPQALGDRIRGEADYDLGLYYIQIQDTAGRLLYRSPNLGTVALPAPEGLANHRTIVIPGLGDVRLIDHVGRGWRIQIASPLAQSRHILGEYTRIASALLGAVALASLAVGWAFARFTLRPVGAIRETALRIRGDNLAERIPIPAGRDELSALAALLNQMFDRLESAFNQARRFTADASHELKTPLTLIRLNAEHLRPRLAADPEAGAQLDDLLDSVIRLQRIVESLLFLAKAEARTFALHLQPTNTTAVINELVEDATALCEDRGVRFVCENDGAHPVRCEPVLVHQLLLNLVSNSVRFTPPGGAVALTSAVVDGQWILRVSDDGPGLPPEQLERVFERFVRFAPTTNPDDSSAGHGLGLAICRSIAELHGGSIRAENRSGRCGLTVETRWPAGGPAGL
ncbi:MAG: HAMP domain-containing protein [Opitutaceae bacterium]|nr:HAMP domain-containing protein [Opitutaceae bacterium]